MSPILEKLDLSTILRYGILCLTSFHMSPFPISPILIVICFLSNFYLLLFAFLYFHNLISQSNLLFTFIIVISCIGNTIFYLLYYSLPRLKTDDGRMPRWPYFSEQNPGSLEIFLPPFHQVPHFD